MYKYKGKIIKVVDADTMDVEFDVGFYIKTTCRIRIKDYDAPESFRPSCKAEKIHALEATQKAKELLEGKEVTVITYKEGAYNRYTADIILDNLSNYGSIMNELGFSKLNNYGNV